ncbi:MAG: TIGR04282 family arsenosugar biosynthesis glycosyltransferase [Balneolales bacterium]
MTIEKEAALIVFVKNPKIGKVKTRLAASIGKQAALDVYLKLLDHTRTITEKVSAQVHIFYSEFIDDADMWPDKIFIKHQQTGAYLGERMQNAFKEIFNIGYKKAVIIGSDCLELETENINQAFRLLNNYDAVIGPAIDGGYYLMGMNRLISAAFENKTWSTSSVFDETIKDFQAHKISWQELPYLKDVDTIDDLKG